MTTRTATPPLRRPHAVPATAALKRHRSDVARWALANGHTLRRDALAALLGSRSGPGGAPLPTCWTVADVVRVLRVDVESWCDVHSVAVPHGLSATLATYLRYLSAHRLLDPGSDHLSLLRRAIAEHRDDDGRRHHPAGTRRAPVLPIS